MHFETIVHLKSQLHAFHHFGQLLGDILRTLKYPVNNPGLSGFSYNGPEVKVSYFNQIVGNYHHTGY